MNFQRLLGSTLTAGLTVFFMAGAAAAQERQPLAQAERPLTLPRLTLAPTASLEFEHVGISSPAYRVDANAFAVDLGLRFGITSDFEVGATLIPLDFAPLNRDVDVYYVIPRFYFTYRFLRGDAEMGFNLQATIFTPDRPLVTLIPLPIDSTKGVTLQPGFPMRFHLSRSARIDTGFFVPIGIGNRPARLPFQSPTQVGAGLKIPFEILFDITEPVHLAVNTGFGIGNFSDAGHSIYIPMGISGGYAVRGHKGPVFDIDAFFQWPSLIVPGADDRPPPFGPGNPKALPGVFETGLELTGYIYL